MHTECADGRLAYRVRHPLGRGQTHRVLTALELLAQLAAILPPPRYPPATRPCRFTGVWYSGNRKPFIMFSRVRYSFAE